MSTTASRLCSYGLSKRTTYLKRKTTVFDLHPTFSFWSFPIDCMQLIMNLTMELLQLWKGENRHLSRLKQASDKSIAAEDGWLQIDSEIAALGKVTSQSVFGAKPRNTTRYSSWKAAEHSVLHIMENIKQCGPLVNCNQICLERFIGSIKNRMHARNLAAESLTQAAKVMEGYKLFYGITL